MAKSEVPQSGRDVVLALMKALNLEHLRRVKSISIQADCDEFEASVVVVQYMEIGTCPSIFEELNSSYSLIRIPDKDGKEKAGTTTEEPPRI